MPRTREAPVKRALWPCREAFANELRALPKLKLGEAVVTLRRAAQRRRQGRALRAKRDVLVRLCIGGLVRQSPHGG